MTKNRYEALHDLLPRCRRGDEDAYMEIYRLFSPMLYGTALRILRKAEEAEDVVQETFVRLVERVDALSPQTAGGWLRRVTINRCLDVLRHRKRWREDELPEMAGRDLADARSASLDLPRAIERLPARTRAVFLLHEVEGYKHHEIAEALEVSVGTSKAQLFRARRMLRSWLEPAAEAAS